MGIAFMSGAAMTLRAGSHIRVTILIAQLPAFGKRLLEIVSSFVGLCLTAFLAWSLALFTWGSFTRGQTSISSDTPVWIPEAAITLGATILALQMLARTLQALWGLPVEDPSLKVASTAE
jgi:TRAP-type C4-dicarboxylate transport system permease small subunit